MIDQILGVLLIVVLAVMFSLPLIAIALLGYCNDKKDFTLFYKFYGFLTGVKYVPQRAKARRKNHR